MGAERAEAQPEYGIEGADQGAWAESGEEFAEQESWDSEPDEPGTSGGAKLLAGLLILLALAWIGFSIFTLLQSNSGWTLQEIASSIALVSGPLILLGLLWLIFGKTPRREADRFAQAVAAMQTETASLDALLQIVAGRLEENHARLTSEAAKLMALGDEASDRLGRVTHYLAKESATLDRKAEALENAASHARVDIGVLLEDLPRAEEQARAVAEAMQEAGLAAHGQAGALEGQLSALIARGREADEVVGGSAQRLGAHLARIESTATSAAKRIQDVGKSMSSSVDETLAKAAEAIDAAREGLDSQGAAMLAMIEQSRSALERAGEDAGRNLGQRLEQVSSKIEQLASHLAAQDAASHALVTGLAAELTDLDRRFAALSETGQDQSERLNSALETVRGTVQGLTGELGGGQEHAAQLIERAEELYRTLANVTDKLGEIPPALAQVEEQAGRTNEAAGEIGPRIEAIQLSAGETASQLGEAEASVARQQQALDALLTRLRDGTATAEEQLRALAAATEEADGAAARIVGDTGPELIDALVRVREAAKLAAEHAREAISNVIPQSAAALGEASGKAVSDAVTEQVERQIGELAVISERAMETARHASERLTRQMLAIGETAAAIEARIDAARREREEKESEHLSRRVALLIESLNSTAIDVTKILSNEVTDSAWNAYLKGDRGVFTRRAVRLLDNSEAREIVAHYEAEPEFREHVNRYIHDFESMLRRILADRDGSPLGITILSSDMGKLYVALAQAIERLRT